MDVGLLYGGLLAAGALWGVLAGLVAGRTLGLPAFALGLILALATQVIADTLAEAGTFPTICRALVLAAVLQVAYGLGLLLRRLRRGATHGAGGSARERSRALVERP
ncbi:hypothetical protein [Salinarimonas rosea]|uniref:hypothetical protein n=1 Tax=Salinarimonas rosea TaxID=552063 RepID=UPI0003FBBFD2|nr:hypothetical protein [Salinarimonas rosea]